MNPTILIEELLSDDLWRAGAVALQSLRPTLDISTFVSKRHQLTAEGYHFVGARIEDEIVSVASYTISPHALYDRELHIHDMATKDSAQGLGCGSQILRYLEEIGRKERCWRIFVHTKNAKEFYRKNEFHEYSTGLVKELL